MLVLVRKQDSNWPRPSRRPSKPPRATFDVPAANNHLQRQPRSYLARSLYHDHLIGAIMAVEIKGSNIIEVAIVAFILAEAGWTAGWPCYLLTHSGRQLQLRRPPSHSHPSPPRPASSSSVAPVSPNSHSRRRNCWELHLRNIFSAARQASYLSRCLYCHKLQNREWLTGLINSRHTLPLYKVADETGTTFFLSPITYLHQ